MRASFLLATSVAFVATGCRSDQPTVLSPDTQVGRAERKPKPYKVRLAVGYPCYLCNDVHTNVRIPISVIDRTNVPIEQVKEMAKQMVVETYPGRVRVRGSWDMRENRSFHFDPDKDLAHGDYLLRFPNASADLHVAPKPYNLFRVGPGVSRLRTVELYADKSDPTGGFSRVVVGLTTASDASLTSTVEKDVGGVWQAVNMVKGSRPGESIKANVSDIIPGKGRLRVTVRSDVLDGAFTGVPGSKKEVTVEFRPEDHSSDPAQVIYHVPLDLGIDLLTGEPKKP